MQSAGRGGRDVARVELEGGAHADLAKDPS